MLLELCLRPGSGARPSYAGALKVLDAQQAVCGTHGSLLLLDPQWVSCAAAAAAIGSSVRESCAQGVLLLLLLLDLHPWAG